MGSKPISVCSNNEIFFENKTDISNVEMKRFPLPSPPKSLSEITFGEYSIFDIPDTVSFPLSDERIQALLPQDKVSEICKAPTWDLPGYYFSDDALRTMRNKIRSEGNILAYGMENASTGLLIFRKPWEVLAGNKGLRVLAAASIRSSVYMSLLSVPLEIHENYHAIKEGDRTLHEGITDGLWDVALGMMAGAVGVAAGAKIGAVAGVKIGAIAGTLLGPGVGTAAGGLVGFVAGTVAGGVIGGVMGMGFDLAKEAIQS